MIVIKSNLVFYLTLILFVFTCGATLVMVLFYKILQIEKCMI